MAQLKVILGMSGGVDSSVAAALLVEQGYDVHGITLQVWEEEDEAVASSRRWQERGCCKVGLAKHVAKLLGIPHQVVDTREAFRKGVVDDFVSGYLHGTTPNPCVRCNERVKFGSLFRLARDLGGDFLATGHYARIQPVGSVGFEILKGVDQKKDQSYFLYRLSPSWLPHILFPLGELQKEKVWRRAEDMGLPTEELKESQEICFVTQGDYRQFLMERAPQAQRAGPFIDREGQLLGQHKGIAFYTPGQRKGLGLATGRRLYVQEVIPETDAVVLGPPEELLRSECMVADLNFFNEHLLNDEDTVEVKIRYASPSMPAKLHRVSPDTLRVQFAAPQGAISPGQSAVFYRGDRVLGGGIIQRFSTRRSPSRTHSTLEDTQSPVPANSINSTVLLPG